MRPSDRTMRLVSPFLGGRAILLGALILAVAGTAFLAGCRSGDGRRAGARSTRVARRQANRPDASMFDRESEDDGDVVRRGGAAPAPEPAQVVADSSADAPDNGDLSGPPIGEPGNPDEALRKLRRDLGVRGGEAEYQQALGDDAYGDADYATAVKHYEAALRLDASLHRVRERLNTAKMLLGRRTGRSSAVAVDLQEQLEAGRQARVAEAKLMIQEAKTLIGEGDSESLSVAESKLARVVDDLSYETDIDQDGASALAEAKGMLAGLAKKAVAAKGRERVDTEREIRDRVMHAADGEARVQRGKVRQLLRKAADYMRFEEFAKAVQICDQILKLEPEHRIAQYWRKTSKERDIEKRESDIMREDRLQRRAEINNFRKTTIPSTAPFSFPEERYWVRIQQREARLAVVRADDPEPVRRIKSILDDPDRVVSFEFQDKPLADVVAFLRQVTGVNMQISREVRDEENSVDLAVQNMTARNALNLILLQTDLAFTFQENVLLITKKDQARGRNLFQIYNVADILNRIRDFQGPILKLKAPGESDEGGAAGVDIMEDDELQDPTLEPEDLVELIKNSTGGEDIWGDGDLMGVEHHNGLLLVNAPDELHTDIQKVLENLREDSDLFVMIEARFIDITDDFLEDVGIDARGLGLVNNIGTPFGNIINDNSTGGNDLGFVKQGSPVRDVTLIMGQDRWGGRVQHIIDGFTGVITGGRLRGGNGVSGLTLQGTWLDPFQINAIVRAVQEKSDVRQLTAPTITAHNGERVYVSVITQRAYIADYELVSGGTGFSIVEVADPIVATFQEGVILDVDPVISPDKKYITLDVRPTMATLIGGVISTILISLGSFVNVAFQVPVGVPEVSLQQTFTSVTVPNGGTVLLGGFKSMSEAKYVATLPILGQIPIIKNLFRRKATLSEKRSLVILITARIVDPRQEEEQRFNTN